MAKIVLTSDVAQDKYTDYVRDAFDLDVSGRNTVEVPCNLDVNTMQAWNIGLICGASGSGKSVIISKLGGLRRPTSITQGRLSATSTT